MRPAESRPGSIIPLGQVTRADRDLVGSKAAILGDLRRAGFAIPDAVVVVGDGPTDPGALQAALGNGPLAVRSSAAAEDLADASFAGQYETVLNVLGSDALVNAIQRVRTSGFSGRTEQYRAARGLSDASHVAVLVQRMLTPDAAGVAFTAHPISGARDQVVINAARGLGEQVVSGETVGDEWIVRAGSVAHRPAGDSSALGADQALAISRLARAVETHMDGVPQDVEWAIEGGHVYLLQARPMTALPESVNWTPPAPGYWLRVFRLGEWLSDPMTPLFQTWLLERLNEGLRAGMRATVGAAIEFPHAAIHGWYYSMAGLNPRAIPATLARAILDSRGRVLPVLFNALVRVNTRPDLADRALLARLAQRWHDEELPAYQQLVARAEHSVEAASQIELIRMVDAVGRCAGAYFWSLAIVGGSAWKMEAALARFIRKHVVDNDGSDVALLLRGLPNIVLGSTPHAVQSIDWYWPLLDEQLPAQNMAPDRRAALVAEREAAEARYRSLLANRAVLLSRFDRLLEVAQRYAAIREQQARCLTIGWPLLRRCVLRLGDDFACAHAIERAEDVFFLTYTELTHAEPDMRDAVQRRRAEWQGQRRLVAPLEIGRPPRIIEAAFAGVTHPSREPGAPEDVIVGQPASPGRATGRVRVVSGPEDFAAFRAGEVLVARATAPAWTPLFATAAAVVTDAGTLAAHASLVAREYGIPAVVGTTDATRRLRTGLVVTVDGRSGTVRIGGP